VLLERPQRVPLLPAVAVVGDEGGATLGHDPINEISNEDAEDGVLFKKTKKNAALEQIVSHHARFTRRGGVTSVSTGKPFCRSGESGNANSIYREFLGSREMIFN
jgi:hypothetical protein